MKRRAFYFKMVVSSLLRRRSRMLTALLAIALGAALLSGLAEIAVDLPRRMREDFRSYGANLVFVPLGEAVFSEGDLEKAASLLPQNELVGLAPFRFKLIKINEQPFMAAGTILSEVKKTSPYFFIQGRWPEKSGEALIGREVAEMIRLAPGNEFTITGNARPEGDSFTVAGIVETGGREEGFVYVSLEDFEMMNTDNISHRLTQINTDDNTQIFFDSAECSITLRAEALAELCDEINAGGGNLKARPVKRLADSENAVLSKLTALVFLVTSVVAVLILICVATTMMAVSAERRKEIGLRKALGAGQESLTAEFLGEGFFLGALGGLAGSGAGFFFARFVGLKVFARAPHFDTAIFFCAALLALVITLIAQAIPVRSAAAVDPAIVLRGE
jgi:putative ABC transport system permease protein